MHAVRTDAMPLVDAWDFSDFRLKSALGRFDGDVYPAIMVACWREPLNATELGPGYADHLGAFIVDGIPAIMAACQREPLNATELGPGYADHLGAFIVDGTRKKKKRGAWWGPHRGSEKGGTVYRGRTEGNVATG